MTQEHPFAQYIRIVGKGPRLSRSLTREEARDATRLILEDKVDPIQLGAFLCVLRVRTEDPNEAAGFIDAVREQVSLPAHSPNIDLDWPTYSGKARQLPYYLLGALAMAQSGIKIFMHGVEGHTDGRLFTAQTLRHLGIPAASSLEDAAQKLTDGNFAYLPLQHIHPVLQKIIDLKSVLGVRTPVNTFARMMNIFSANTVLQCITHLAYREIHRDSAELLSQKRMCVFKGEGGEIERRAAKPVIVQHLVNGERLDEEWPAFLSSEYSSHDTEMDINRLVPIWRGEDCHPYAISAIIGTIAIALRAMGKANNQQEAHEQANIIWAQRETDKIPYAE